MDLVTNPLVEVKHNKAVTAHYLYLQEINIPVNATEVHSVSLSLPGCDSCDNE